MLCVCVQMVLCVSVPMVMCERANGAVCERANGDVWACQWCREHANGIVCNKYNMGVWQRCCGIANLFHIQMVNPLQVSDNSTHRPGEVTTLVYSIHNGWDDVNVEGIHPQRNFHYRLAITQLPATKGVERQLDGMLDSHLF